MVDLRGMKADYDIESRTYTVQGISARDAHVLIWGGREKDIDAARIALRHALVVAEDSQMPDEHYHESAT